MGRTQSTGQPGRRSELADGAPTRRRSASARRVVVAGVGNEMRRDDGAGPLIVRRAAGMAGPGGMGGNVLLAGPVVAPVELIGVWDDADLAVVVDAVRSGAPPGTVSLTWLASGGTVGEAGSPGKAGPRREPGTHGLGIPDVYRLACEAGRAPSQVALVGVEGQDFSHGEGLSQAVQAGVKEAAELVVRLAAQEGE